MNLPEQYATMRQAALRQFAQGAAEVDALLGAPHDTRRGLTLLARPPAAVTARLETMLADFRQAEPEQYYYPATDIHLTILSIISCYPGFSLQAINPEEYRRALRGILQAARPFTIRYAGLTASPGGIMVQGFPQDGALASLRQTIREFFQHADLPHSIDQRYRLQTAHSTVIRFKKPLANPVALLEEVSKYQAQDFGSFKIASVELVYNDWYQQAAHTVLLEKYPLGR
jgi:2'-5' RNA ligase